MEVFIEYLLKFRAMQYFSMQLFDHSASDAYNLYINYSLDLISFTNDVSGRWMVVREFSYK